MPRRRSRRALKRLRKELGFDDSNETCMADLCVSSSGVASSVLVNGERSMGEDVKSNRKKKMMEIESVQAISIVVKDERGVEIVEEVTKDEEGDNDKSVELNAGESTSNNMVLRKLLRGPRYFDAPNGGWESCSNCGKEGHMTINCPSLTRRKKPCFVCGSLEHGGKQCVKARECYICKQGGHRAKDCPDKYKSTSRNTTVCLRCGESGHDMLSCKYEYSQDDLKDIQCYVCKTFGHLCCVDPFNSPRWVVSCYRCGQSGHTGLACGKLNGGSTGRDLLSSCFRCGEEGHFSRECPNSSGFSFSQGKDSAISCYRCRGIEHSARECPNSTQGCKRNHDTSMPSRKRRKKTKGNKEHHSSAPHELNGKTKRKREWNLETPGKVKNRGGWATEYPEEEDTYPRKRKSRNMRPPPSGPSPSGVNHWISSFSLGGCPPSAPFSRIPFYSHDRNAASGFSDQEWQPSSTFSRVPFSSHDRNAASASRFSDRHCLYKEWPPSSAFSRVPFSSHESNAALASRFSDRHCFYEEWPPSSTFSRVPFSSRERNAASASASASGFSDRHCLYEEWPLSSPFSRIPFASHDRNAASASGFSEQHCIYGEWQPSLPFYRIPFASHERNAASASGFSDHHYYRDEY